MLCKTAQVVPFQQTHAGGPRLSARHKRPTIPWAFLRWIALPRLARGSAEDLDGTFYLLLSHGENNGCMDTAGRADF